MFCHVCGNQTPDDAEFCHKCGTMLIIEDVVQQPLVTFVEENRTGLADKPSASPIIPPLSALGSIQSPILNTHLSDALATDGSIQFTRTHPRWLIFVMVMVIAISALILIAEILLPFANATLEWMPRLEWWGISIVGLIGVGTVIALLASPRKNNDKKRK